MKVLNISEVSKVSGSDRGDAAVTGATAFSLGLGGGAYSVLRGANYGMRIGLAGGLFGMVGGAIIGGGAGYFIYTMAK